MRQPDIFDPKDLEQEMQQWSDWSFRFKAFIMVQDPKFKDELEKCEVATEFTAFSAYPADMQGRAIRLYAMLASYLQGRPLKLLRAVPDSNGCMVWRQLHDELAPRTRPRTLALAQTLTRFPAYKEGTSILEYILTYERLVRDSESVSTSPCADDLKIGTLLSGLPSEMRRYLQMQVTDSTTYESLRERVLQYERSSSSWNADHVLKALGVDRPPGGDDPTPMDFDHVETKGKGKGKNRKGKGYKGSGKNDNKGKGKYGKQQPYNKGGKDSKGKGKYNQAKGKGKGGERLCFICHKPGHVAAECRHRVNQVQEGDAVSVSNASVSTAPTSATSLAKSKPTKVQRINLTEIESEDEVEITYFNEVRCVSEVESGDADSPDHELE